MLVWCLEPAAYTLFFYKKLFYMKHRLKNLEDQEIFFKKLNQAELLGTLEGRNAIRPIFDEIPFIRHY